MTKIFPSSFQGTGGELQPLTSLTTVAEDTTARCLEELVRYFRHSAVGRRATGIIHNINTPLQVISFQLELLEQKAEEEQQQLQTLPEAAHRLAPLQEYRDQKLQQLRREVNRLRDMIHRLVIQAVHEGEREQCYLDLNQVFQDELNLYLADPFFKHRVEKVFSFFPGLPPLYGHYIDFSQSFRHLVDNALEAMADSDHRRLTVTTALEEGHRLLRVGDTGSGISLEVLPQIFKPFFTTKGDPTHPRAGLGLFLTRRLLAPYGGEILMESKPGETWVTLRFPINKEA
jgi:signal transduction histidine kinase